LNRQAPPLAPFPAPRSPPHRDAGSGLQLRAATAGDMPFLRDLYAEVRGAEFAALRWPERVTRQLLEQQFQAQHCDYLARFPAGEFWILEIAGEAVGRCYVAERGEDLQLVEISLREDRRGRGLGTLLLDWLKTRAAGAGMPLRLHVEARNHGARRLYLRAGFRVEADIPPYLRMAWHAGDAPVVDARVRREPDAGSAGLS
jgi:GNAT superfamily N-acetyltransferase